MKENGLQAEVSTIIIINVIGNGGLASTLLGCLVTTCYPPPDCAMSIWLCHSQRNYRPLCAERETGREGGREGKGEGGREGGIVAEGEGRGGGLYRGMKGSNLQSCDRSHNCCERSGPRLIF